MKHLKLLSQCSDTAASSYFMMIIAYSAFLLIISAICVRTNHEHGDVFIRCGWDSNRDMKISCNLTNHMQSIPSCPPQSLIVPGFNKLKIECGTERTFLASYAGCRIFDLGDEKKEIFHANGSLFFNGLYPLQEIMDGLLTFESLFSNAFSLGKAFVRCRPSHSNKDKLVCSLFGISEKYFASGNLSCSVISQFPDGDTHETAVMQCGFSEDHVSGKFRGNVTTVLKIFGPSKKLEVDVVLVAKTNNAPWNIIENLRMNCHVVETQVNEDEMIECAAYLNENRFCENPECCRKEESRETDETSSEGNRTRDIIWELDRTIEVDIEHTDLGRTKFTCNIATDVAISIIKCSVHFSNEDVYLDKMPIIDVAFTRTTVSINSFNLIRLNISNLVSFRGILIKKCEVDFANSTISCEFQPGKNEQLKGRLHCEMQISRQQNITYFIACAFSLPNEQTTFEGQLSYFTGDHNITAVTLAGQLKSVDRPEVIEALSISCKFKINDLFQYNVNPANLNCKVDFMTPSKVCELFQSLCA